MQEQLIPAAATRDPNSIEMLRVWIAEKGLHCSIRVGMYEENGVDETRAWGILLSDVIRHVSQALKNEYERPVELSETNILDHLVQELCGPTSKITGNFVRPSEGGGGK